MSMSDKILEWLTEAAKVADEAYDDGVMATWMMAVTGGTLSNLAGIPCFKVRMVRRLKDNRTVSNEKVVAFHEVSTSINNPLLPAFSKCLAELNLVAEEAERDG